MLVVLLHARLNVFAAAVIAHFLMRIGLRRVFARGFDLDALVQVGGILPENQVTVGIGCRCGGGTCCRMSWDRPWR